VNRLATIWILLVLGLAGTGCGPRNQRIEDFIPQEPAARDSLDACLRSWVRGDAAPAEGAQQVPDTRPPVLFADIRRSKGHVLTSYSILGPVPGEAPRCFAVRLSFKNQDEIRDRYVVVGQDPIWVCRYDDYLMVAHWSHEMPARPESKK
jgi:hypothetical protein